MKMDSIPPGVELRKSYVCLLHPEERAEEPGNCPIDGNPLIPYSRQVGRALAIPREGLLTIGTRHFVFEKVGEGKFEPREISIGPTTNRFAPLIIVPRTGQYYPHLQTVRRGDSIVMTGAYYLDSQLQLQGKLSIFAPTLPALEALAPAERFLSEYFLAGRALSDDRVKGFDRRLERMREVMKEALAVQVHSSAHGARPTGELQAHFRHMEPGLHADSPDSIKGARKIFAALGEGMKMYVEKVHSKIYGASKIHLFKDPETGEIWAQGEKKPANPFRGKAGLEVAEKIKGDKEEEGEGDAGEGSGTKGGGAHAHH
jgi:hypothetical protein